MCERFFTQTTRFRDLHGDLPVDAFSEMELIDMAVLPAELSLQEFHSFALSHDLVWMNEGAFIATDFNYDYIINGKVNDEYRAMYNRTLGTYECCFTACFSDMTFSVFASSHWLATVHSDFLVGLFTRSNMPDARFHSQSMLTYRRPLLPVSGEALTELVTQEGTSRKLALFKFHLDESHFHALRRATSSLKVTLDLCNVMFGPDYLPAAVAVTAFVECLQGIACPLYMIWDDINTSVLAQALPGASQLRKLTLNKPEVGAPPSVGSIFESFQVNTGLLESFQANTSLLELKVSTEFDEFDFPTLCHSLQSHTTLKSLAVYIPIRLFWSSRPPRKTPVRVLSEENKTMLLEAMHGLLKTNTVLHTIGLPWCLIGTPLYEEEMVPRLEKNRFRRHFLAIKAAPVELRIKLLCAALSLISTTSLIFEVFRDSVDVLLPMLLADDMKSVPIGAQNKAELEAEISELVESFEMKDLLLELLSMVESPESYSSLPSIPSYVVW
jgi:hypothetical protein